MDMARATRARIECLSCHRCHLFRIAERTCGHRAECDTQAHTSPGPRTLLPPVRLPQQLYRGAVHRCEGHRGSHQRGDSHSSDVADLHIC